MDDPRVHGTQPVSILARRARTVRSDHRMREAHNLVHFGHLPRAYVADAFGLDARERAELDELLMIGIGGYTEFQLRETL